MTKQEQMDPERALVLATRRFHELDTCWEDQNTRTRLLLELRAFLSAFENSPDERLLRLAHASKLVSVNIPLQRLYQIMVPIERMSQSTSVTDPDFITHSDFTEARAPIMPVHVVLDDIRSAFNVGSIFRTAECMGVQSIHLGGYTAQPDNPRVARAALGTDQHLEWASGETHDILSGLKDEGVTLVAMETCQNAVSLDDWAPDFPTALVLGNERFGLSTETLNLVDTVISIPLYGAKNSLNVGAALAIVARDCRRHWQNAE